MDERTVWVVTAKATGGYGDDVEAVYSGEGAAADHTLYVRRVEGRQCGMESVEVRDVAPWPYRGYSEAVDDA